MPKKSKGIFLYIGTIIAVVIAFSAMTRVASLLMNGKPDDAKYSEFIEKFDTLQVSEYDLDLNSSKITYKLKNDEKQYIYEIPNLNIFLEDIEGYRQKYNEANPDAPIVYDQQPIKQPSIWVEALPMFGMMALLLVVFFFISRQAAGGGKISQFSRANTKNQKQSNVTFDDVAGADEEKAELAEVVEFLKNPAKYSALGARVPKGVLLLGPPGTGKTLLAKAVAGEAKAPFFSISGSDFVEMFVGVGASRVRDLFDQAKKNAPSIIFIDEIDAVGRHRGAGLGGGHDEREQTLNQLLVEMDGFTPNQNVIVIAATNRRDILDPALLRPGRFDRQIVVGYPDIKGREEILKVHTRNKPLAPDVSLKTIARSTAGFTGAELENLANEAALLAARANRKAITKEDIEEATMKVIAGPEKKSRVVTEEDKRLVAFHEAGHAVAAYHLPTQDKVHQVTIVPRGTAGGMTINLPEKEPSYLNITARKLKEEIILCMGGRVAENLVMGEASAGAISDLQRATKLAKAMVTEYGFSEKLGPVVYSDDNDEPFVGMDYGHTKGRSEKLQSEIDTEVRAIIDECYEKTVELLKEHTDQLNRVAEYLIEHEKIDGDDFEKLMKGELAENTPEEEPTEASNETSEND